MAKVKMKTNKSIQSRFKVTGNGKLKRNKQGRRHLLTKMSSNKKRQLAKPALVDQSFVTKYKRLMGE